VHINSLATACPAVNQIVFMLGAADKLVATSQDAANQALFVALYPRLKDVPPAFDSGLTQVNRETLLSTHPDVIFASSTSQALRDALDATGIPTVVLASFTGPDQIKAGVSMVADVLGGDAPGRAQHFASYYDGNVARVQAVTANIAQTEQPKALYNDGNPLVTEGQGSIVTTWMNQAGARNVAAENGVMGVLVPITFETVLGASGHRPAAGHLSVERAQRRSGHPAALGSQDLPSGPVRGPRHAAGGEGLLSGVLHLYAE
jgi:iron complex transport system substrate-binding protein